MRWMITDSGLGGLSVCAGLEQSLSQKNMGQGIELLYVNATPDDRIGYNSLNTQKERIDLFDQFLNAANHRYSPDEIAIACNTLSVSIMKPILPPWKKLRSRGLSMSVYH